MLRYVYGSELSLMPRLADSMFKHRTQQFRDRLGWDVTVDAMDHERDDYDGLNPLYVIWENDDGTHGGSMRFLPTTGRTMIAEHFAYLTGNIRIESPLIWECTRFCLAPGADGRVTAGLVLGAGEIMHHFHLSHFIGVFDCRMQRIYSRLGVKPDVIGHQGEGRDMIGVGLWEMQGDAWEPTLTRVGVDRTTSRLWLERSLAIRPLYIELPIMA